MSYEPEAGPSESTAISVQQRYAPAEPGQRTAVARKALHWAVGALDLKNAGRRFPSPGPESYTPNLVGTKFGKSALNVGVPFRALPGVHRRLTAGWNGMAAQLRQRFAGVLPRGAVQGTFFVCFMLHSCRISVSHGMFLPSSQLSPGVASDVFRGACGALLSRARACSHSSSS